MGEIGHNTFEWQETYSRTMQENNIGYTFWPYKKRDIECMRAFDVPDNWDDLIVAFAQSDRQDFAKIRQARPDQDAAWEAMCRFTENIRFENCHTLDGYVQSMLLK